MLSRRPRVMSSNGGFDEYKQRRKVSTGVRRAAGRDSVAELTLQYHTNSEQVVMDSCIPAVILTVNRA